MFTWTLQHEKIVIGVDVLFMVRKKISPVGAPIKVFVPSPTIEKFAHVLKPLTPMAIPASPPQLAFPMKTSSAPGLATSSAAKGLVVPMPTLVPAVTTPVALRLPFTVCAPVKVLAAPSYGTTVVSMVSVPVFVIGPPVSPSPVATLVTVPSPVPGKVYPVAKVKMPLLLSFNPVSLGVLVPSP